MHKEQKEEQIFFVTYKRAFAFDTFIIVIKSLFLVARGRVHTGQYTPAYHMVIVRREDNFYWYCIHYPNDIAVNLL